jgi:hypothetical protein
MKQAKLVSPKNSSDAFIHSALVPRAVAWLGEKAGSCHATCQLCWLSEHGQRSAKRGDRGNLISKSFAIVHKIFNPVKEKDF